jgi:hypothetical protein
VDDAQLRRLIAERFEIEQKVIAARKDQSQGNELESDVEEVESEAQASLTIRPHPPSFPEASREGHCPRQPAVLTGQRWFPERGCGQ